MLKDIFSTAFVYFLALVLVLSPVALIIHFNVSLGADTMFYVVALLLIIIVSSFLLGKHLFGRMEKQIGRKTTISDRDVSASFNVIKAEVERIAKTVSAEKVEESGMNELRVRVKNIQNKVDDLEKYIIKGINEIYIKNQF